SSWSSTTRTRKGRSCPAGGASGRIDSISDLVAGATGLWGSKGVVWIYPNPVGTGQQGPSRKGHARSLPFLPLRQRCRPGDGDGGGGGVGPAVRDGQEHVRDLHAHGLVARRPADVQFRLAAGVVAHLQVGPADAAPPSRPQALQNGLLGGPAAGEVLRRVL